MLTLQWQEQGDVDVDIGANPSAEGGDDEAVDSSSKKVVDLIDAFRLNVSSPWKLGPFSTDFVIPKHVFGSLEQLKA